MYSPAPRNEYAQIDRMVFGVDSSGIHRHQTGGEFLPSVRHAQDREQGSSCRFDESRKSESKGTAMNQETSLLDRITVRPDIFGGRPIIRGMRFAVEHVLAKLAAGETVDTILDGEPVDEIHMERWDE